MSVGAVYPLPYPLVNGHQYSFASIEVWSGGLPIPQIGLSAINYSSKLTPGKLRGTRPHVLGRTRGEADHSADVEMHRLAFENLKVTLGVAGEGFGETEFDWVVVFAEAFGPVITDTIVRSRITEISLSNQSGTDPSMVKLTLDPLDVLYNGVSIVAPLAL